MSTDTTNPVDAVLLDDYGKPIGQLVVNMSGPSAVQMPDNAIEDAKEDALEDNAAQLPGISSTEIAEYYPGYDDHDKREKAKRMILNEGRSVVVVAQAVGVPERTVLMWVANGKWAEARRREILAKDELSRLDLAETRIRERNSVFHSQLDQAKRIREKALSAIENESISVRSGAEAWAAAAKTEQTILGLSDAGKVAAADGSDDADEKGKSGSGNAKAPLVMVFQGGGLPPIRRPQ